VIIKFALVGGLAMALIAFLLITPMYTAEAVFIAPQTSPGSAMSQMASQLGSLGALGGLSGFKSMGDMYVGILGSRTIADEIIEQFNLQAYYKQKKLSDTEKLLKGRSKFNAGKDTLVTVSVTDKNAEMAAKLTNAYVDSMRKKNGSLALTEASQRRLFFEEQLEREKNALANAEVDLKKTQEQTGMISPLGQTQVVIQQITQLRAEIASREVQLGSLKQGATDENPQVVLLKTEIAGLRSELNRLQNDTDKQRPGNIQLPTAKVPELALDYVRKQREVKYHETLFELIAKQYETARMDEARDAPILQIVDRAVVPDRKSWPPRLLFILAGLMLGAFAGAGWVFFQDHLAQLRKEPAGAEELDALRKAIISGR
jgi:uncharacterized protein involved in exopolysaccharide biosynthesis